MVVFYLFHCNDYDYVIHVKYEVNHRILLIVSRTDGSRELPEDRVFVGAAPKKEPSGRR